MRRSARDERGAVVILVSLSLVVLGMASAMAVDVGQLAQLHRHAQSTVDDAAISGADLLEKGTDSLNQIVTATEAYIDENWGSVQVAAWGTCPSIPAGFSVPAGSAENCVTFNATATAINVVLPPQSVPFTLARLGGFTSGTVEASATAVTVPGTSPCALCVLGSSGVTLNDTGSGRFSVTDGPGSGNAGIIVNSPSTPAAAITGGSGTISAPGGIDVVGTYSSGNGGFTPTPTTGVSPVPDPLGDLVAPTPTSTTIPSGSYQSSSGSAILPSGTYGSISIDGSASVTIPPGNYSSIKVTGNATLTLAGGPDPYFITGAFTVGGTGTASVIEDGGVLLYFTCSSGNQVTACASGGQSGGSLDLSGTGDMTLSPMTTGPYANLTVFYDRNNSAPMTLKGTPGLKLSGTVYAKSSDLALEGDGGFLSSLLVVKSATISGNAGITVNYDASQNASVPGAPYLCSTTANNC